MYVIKTSDKVASLLGNESAYLEEGSDVVLSQPAGQSVIVIAACFALSQGAPPGNRSAYAPYGGELMSTWSYQARTIPFPALAPGQVRKLWVTIEDPDGAGDYYESLLNSPADPSGPAATLLPVHLDDNNDRSVTPGNVFLGMIVVTAAGNVNGSPGGSDGPKN